MRILIVEDEEKIANSVKKGLQQESYIADAVYDGIAGYDMAVTEEYDAIILDIMLPGLTGTDIVKRLRDENVTTPVLMLTAKGSLGDKVHGLNLGADDYLVKPFAFEELLARLKAITRRPRPVSTEVISVEDLSVDTVNFDVNRSGRPVKLSRKEYALLEYLVRNSGSVISKDQIISNVWDYDADILPNTVEVYIGYLRQKIDKAFPGKPKLLHTVRGFGYRIGGRK